MSVNPLLKHPILQLLPVEQLRDPTFEGIKQFLFKRSKRLRQIKYLMVVFFVLQVAGMCYFADLQIKENGLRKLDSVSDLMELIILPTTVVLLHITGRKYHLSDQEIRRSITDFEIYKSGRPAS